MECASPSLSPPADQTDSDCRLKGFTGRDGLKFSRSIVAGILLTEDICEPDLDRIKDTDGIQA